MGVRTTHYVPGPRSQSEQNQPIEVPVQNPVAANINSEPSSAAASVASGSSTKARGKSKGKTNKRKKPIVVIPLPPPPEKAVAPPEKKTPPKKSAKKRKQKQNGKVSQLKEEKVEKLQEVGIKEADVPPPSPPPLVTVKEVEAPPLPASSKKDKKDELNADKNPDVAVAGANNGLKKGIIKANNKMKKGMRIMMERTNKILDRSRKKVPRKRSPVKPRILPARASARLCVRKNSGEHDQGMQRTDQPLRTVELIRRPLELRDPATKLLYLASLGLYPKADPESDTTPIVIISEEIPNSGGKKPKLRSRELPLMPNWRGSSHQSSNRATGLADTPAVLVGYTSITSPNVNGETTKNSSVGKSLKRKKPSESQGQDDTPPAKRKAAKSRSKAKASKNVMGGNLQQAEPKNEGIKKVANTDVLSVKVTQDTEQVTNGNKKVSSKESLLITKPFHPLKDALATDAKPVSSFTEIKYPLAPGLTISPIKPPRVLLPNAGFSKPSAHMKGKSSAKLEFVGISSEQANFYPSLAFTSVSVSHSIQNKQQPETPKESNATIFPATTTTTTASNDNAQISKPPQSATLKRKRKSLETIIKEIPKVKTQKLDLTPVKTETGNGLLLPCLADATVTSSNPILESLMKNPVKKRKPRPKKVEYNQQQVLSITPINLQNPISMSVPLQPAPGNSTNVLPVAVKEAAPKPRNKKQQSQYQLPMPLPIPLPPGILNYASLASNNIDMSNKSKKQRKTKTPKLTAILDIPSVPQVQTHSQKSSNKNNPLIPYLPSHLEAFFHTLPINGSNSNATSMPQMDQALDLCVKSQPMPVVQPKRAKKAKAVSTKSLLKPLNVEEEVPLNLVMIRGSTHVPTTMRKSDAIEAIPIAAEIPQKAQGNLENVKQMLARLHTKIAPAVNGVQLITIE